MAPLRMREWLGLRRVKARHAPGEHISGCGERGEGDEYADVPAFLLPLDLRAKRYAAEPYPTSALDITFPHKDPHTSTSTPTRKHKHQHKRPHARKRTMPSLIERLTSATTPPSYPIVVAQYKHEYRGVGHEPSLHWALVVLTDRAALSGPSFQAYAQTRRARRPRLSDSSAATASSAASGSGNGRTRTSRRSTSASVTTMGTLGLEVPDGPPLAGPDVLSDAEKTDAAVDVDVQWYTRQGKASLLDVCSTVRTLCLGAVQVGSIKAADLDKLVEYLQSHPPVPTTPGWCSRDYVLELLELLRPFKLLRADLQNVKPKTKGAKVEVTMADLLPELREVGKATQESIDREDYRPVVKYHPS
ncbi:hypothetical protein OH77DRAFT_1590950 [Trametes cingulata]|nr:hypothetical protein OH77DRAFT_1590950 [Trametes cingulata]